MLKILAWQSYNKITAETWPLNVSCEPMILIIAAHWFIAGFLISSKPTGWNHGAATLPLPTSPTRKCAKSSDTMTSTLCKGMSCTQNQPMTTDHSYSFCLIIGLPEIVSPSVALFTLKTANHCWYWHERTSTVLRDWQMTWVGSEGAWMVVILSMIIAKQSCWIRKWTLTSTLTLGNTVSNWMRIWNGGVLAVGKVMIRIKTWKRTTGRFELETHTRAHTRTHQQLKGW